jgi:hypothetical protein
MSASPPGRTGYLRLFLLSLSLVLVCLLGLLFGVRMEAVVPATGIVKARDQQDLRALVAGPVEPGWYEGEVVRPGAVPLRARLDADGNGQTDPAQGGVLPVQAGELADGSGLRVGPTRWHRLRAGDMLWPGQPVARVRAEDLRQQFLHVEQRLQERQSQGETDPALRAEHELLRERLAQAVLRAPTGEPSWLVLKVHVEPLAPVRPGDAVALVAPCDATGRPRDLVAELEVSESHGNGLEPGQAVRLYSTMYNHRLHGHAEARLEHLDPWADGGQDGSRLFHAVAAITNSPFPLPLGSSLKAEVVTGRKAVYRLILEH